MIMKAAPLLLLLPLLRCAADLDFHARMQASLEASLAQYPAVPKSTEAVSRYLAGVLFAPTFSVLVYEGRLFVDRRFLGAEKNRKHANFVASALAHEHVHNAAYFFSGNSTGLCDRDRDRDAPVAPCLVIAKVGGHGMRGVLVPNPYFQDVGYWDAVRSHVRARAATRPFAGRDPRLFWRGHISSSYHAPGDPLHPEPCADEFGNHARLEAMAAGLRAPETVDVKCWILSKRRAGVLGKDRSDFSSESSSSSRERSAPNRRRRPSALLTATLIGATRATTATRPARSTPTTRRWRRRATTRRSSRTRATWPRRTSRSTSTCSTCRARRRAPTRGT